ncbi:MAG: zinc-dependent metalloprotease, partial [Actinobacteria bacterium]|nr:zinc-dependent metalloprotease [Actinomycetota bacterium]
MPEVIDWATAESVAVRSVGIEPFSRSYHYASLTPDFERFTVEAEAAVAAETGLVSLAGAARARVTDRPGWVRANVASFQRLLRPLSDRLGERMAAGPGASLARRVAGAELGMFLGWMSRRVLGQYDLLVIEDENPEDQDIVYFVGPNVLSLERRFAFPPEEFRLWLALHELTHRAQFTGVPWMREHFLGLVETTFSALDPDPGRILASLNRAVDEFRHGRNPLDDGGLAVVFASPEQRDALEHLSGLMSLLEGHGDVTMNRAGAAEIPSADRFHRILHARRTQVNPLMKL